MANAYTDTSAGTLGTSLVQTAYDRLIEFKLRALPIYRGIADKRPTEQNMPGASVVMQFYNDLSVVTTPLSEDTDPDAVALPSTSSVSVTLQEYGNPVLVTRKLQLVSLSDVDEGIADIVAFNMRDSLDAIVSPILMGGTHVVRNNSATLKSDLNAAGSGAQNLVLATDLFGSPYVRFSTAKLRGNKVVPRQGELYGCLIHPDVSADLRAETGAGAWRDPHNFSGAEAIWSGMLGVYESAYFVESPRLPKLAGAGGGSTAATVYQTLFYGRQALAEAVAEEPHFVVGNVTDKLMRFRPLGWYGMLGWARYREDALIRVETSSSLA